MIKCLLNCIPGAQRSLDPFPRPVCILVGGGRFRGSSSSPLQILGRLGGKVCLEGDVGGGLRLGSRQGPFEDVLEVEEDVVIAD